MSAIPSPTAAITLIPPTHEQSVFTFHVEESRVTRFVEFLEQKGLAPWRPPVALEKEDPAGDSLIQVEVESTSTQEMMQNLVDEFLGDD